MGVFCKKVENGGVFCKKVDLSSTQGALCTVSVFFYFTFYLFGGGVRTHPCLQACCKGGMSPWGSADKLYLDSVNDW